MNNLMIGLSLILMFSSVMGLLWLDEAWFIAGIVIGLVVFVIYDSKENP